MILARAKKIIAFFISSHYLFLMEDYLQFNVFTEVNDFLDYLSGYFFL